MKKIINVLVSAVGAILWRLGGAAGYSKSFRRVGVAVVLGILSYFKTHKTWVVISTVVLACIAFSLGYGEHSTIAKFVDNIGNISSFLHTLYVRLIVGFLYGISYLPTIICLKKWKYLYTIGLVTILVPFFALVVPKLGLPRHDIIEEACIGFFVTFCYTLIKEK